MICEKCCGRGAVIRPYEEEWSGCAECGGKGFLHKNMDAIFCPYCGNHEGLSPVHGLSSDSKYRCPPPCNKSFKVVVKVRKYYTTFEWE